MVEVVHDRQVGRAPRWYPARYVYVVSSILPNDFLEVGENKSLTEIDGMTSLSVRQYILGVLKAHGLSEKDVTKVGLCCVMGLGHPDESGSSKRVDRTEILDRVSGVCGRAIMCCEMV